VRSISVSVTMKKTERGVRLSRKPVSAIMFTLLLMSMLTLAINIQPIKSEGVLAPADWPMFHRDLCRTGFLNASSSGYLPYARLLWKCDIGSEVCSSPVVSDLDRDGRVEIVVGTQDGVYCFCFGIFRQGVVIIFQLWLIFILMEN
jgi:hypothetical protein